MLVKIQQQLITPFEPYGIPPVRPLNGDHIAEKVITELEKGGEIMNIHGDLTDDLIKLTFKSLALCAGAEYNSVECIIEKMGHKTIFHIRFSVPGDPGVYIHRMKQYHSELTGDRPVFI